MVTAGNIPDYIEADLENLEIGETINISDITLPEDTRPVIADRDFVIANIAAPGGAADDEDEDVAEDAAEGETPEGEAPEADSEA
jgi:large subunit ribosomal protein L25